MTIQEAAHQLHEHLKATDRNYQIVGIAETTGTIVAYTLKKPTAKELELTEYEGFKVQWHKMGKIEIKPSKKYGGGI